ncbi:MAG: hypothetical protein IJD13_04045 [Oscillospiraceae bacterium]|nr:hypothetical protein [Oscillospiraceae bacterium]
MALVQIDFEKAVKPIKPLHGVGQPPFRGMNFSLMHYLTEAGIPFSRLHDVGGMYGGGIYVDIPNIFRNFDADPSLPENYDFAFTDVLLEKLHEAGVEPWYRLGVTIENYQNVKAYRIFPPKDDLRWAKICEGIIRHYTEGWADGYHYNIRYWEIWNEPENGPDQEHNAMWKGSMERYFEFYGTASRYLKKRFPHLKFGGYAACGFYHIAVQGPHPFLDELIRRCPEYPDYTVSFTHHPYDGKRARDRMDYLEQFLHYAAENDCPLDFFSWHSYEDEPVRNAIYAEYVRMRLDAHGFTGTESSLDEWNPKTAVCGTAEQAARAAANLIRMQRGSVDTAMFYDGRWGVGLYAMFHPVMAEPFPVYYPFLYFNSLYALGTQAYVWSDDRALPVCAASDGKKGAVLLANYSGSVQPLIFETPGWKIVSCRITDDIRTDEEIPLPEMIGNNSTMLLTVEKQ